ncbi:MAG: rod shape-determining protein RodA [bacterium]
MKMLNIFKKLEILPNKNFKRNILDFVDFKTIGLVALLMFAGLLSIYSASSEPGFEIYFYKQVMFVAIGFGVMLFIVFVPDNWIKFNSIFIYLISLALLIAVLIFGKTISGTKGWFQLSGFSFQPAEFAKLAVLLLVSRFLSQKGIDIKNLRDLLSVLGLFALPVALIVIQPDIGSASVVVVLMLGILFWVGFDLLILYFIAFAPFVLILSLIGLEYFIGSLVFFSISSIFFKKKLFKTVILISLVFVVGYFSQNIIQTLPQNTQDRIDIFLNPEKDPLNKGYNVLQSIMAVGSGGFTGKGYKHGSQTQLRYIPEQRTDFIFCVPTEEFGFIGGSIIIILFGLLFVRILSVASESTDKFFSIISFGIGSVFLYHVTVNIGMVIGIMPIMGITLPLMSYGGTALIVNMAMIGLLLKAYGLQKKKG